jgi:phage-related protein
MPDPTAFENLKALLGDIGKQVSELATGSMVEFRDRFAEIGKSFLNTTAAAVTLNASLNIVQQGIGAVTSKFGEFVNAWNPSEMNRFRFAVTDMNAAIGRALTPTLEKFTLIVRTVGDAIASAGAPGQKLVAALAVAAVSMVTMTAATFAFSSAVNSATFGLSALIGAVVGLGAGMAFVMKPTGELKEILSQVGNVISTVMNVVGQGAQAIAQAVGPAIQSVLQVVMTFVTTAAEIANTAIEPMKAIWEQIGGVIQRLVGTLSGILLPIFERMLGQSAALGGQMAKMFGDMFETAAPAIEAIFQVIGAFAEIYVALGGIQQSIMLVFTSILQAIQPIFVAILRPIGAVANLIGSLAGAFGAIGMAIGQLIAAIVEAVSPVVEIVMELIQGPLNLFIAVVTMVAEAIRDLTDWFMRLLGITVQGTGASTFKDDASEGMGVRNARIGSLESYGQAALTSAFSLGVDKTEKPEIVIKNEVGEIKKDLKTLIGKVNDGIAEVSKVITAITGIGSSAINSLPPVAAWDAARRLADRITG